MDKNKIIKFCKDMYKSSEMIIHLFGWGFAIIISVCGLSYVINNKTFVNPPVVDLSILIENTLFLYVCFIVVIIQMIAGFVFVAKWITKSKRDRDNKHTEYAEYIEGIIKEQNKQ